jgi:hypothetical protein
MSIGTIIKENAMEGPQENEKIGLPYNPEILLLGILQREVKSMLHGGTWCPVLTRAKIGNNSNVY